MKLFKHVSVAVMSLAAVFTIGSAALSPQPALAANDALSETCKIPANANKSICKNKSDNIGAGGFASSLTNTLFFVIGALAVIMIIFGGIRYATSNGDAGNVKKAKDTILYSVVGLIVTLMAYAIVAFVIDQMA